MARGRRRHGEQYWANIGLAGLALAVCGLVVFAMAKNSTPVAQAGSSPGYTPPAPPASVHLAVIGDSYTGGSDQGGTGQANWTAVVAQRLREEGNLQVFLDVAAAGGSGYVNRGPTGRVFRDLVPEAVSDTTDVVVIFGSRNDIHAPDEVGAAAAEVFALAKERAPDARLLVVGPPWVDDDPPRDLLTVRDDLAEAAAEAGATFVDPVAEDWFAGDTAELIGADGVHPTDKGHAYMADQLVDDIGALVADSA